MTVSNKSQVENECTGKKDVGEWDQAIKDARERIRGLKLSIKVFKARRDNGESFPPFERAERSNHDHQGVK
jgi:hypothetical protein